MTTLSIIFTLLSLPIVALLVLAGLGSVRRMELESRALTGGETERAERGPGASFEHLRAPAPEQLTRR